MRLVRRVALAAVGAGVIATSLVGALLVAGLFLDVLRGVDLATFAATFAALTLGLGYLSYRTGAARVLAGIGATDLPRERAPGLYARFDALCARMGVDPPRLLVTHSRSPNAFAVGDAVVLDLALFRLLSPDELEAILAHELAHVERRDGLASTLAFSVARTLVGLVALALAPAAMVLSGLARGSALLAGRPRAWRATVAGRARARLDAAVAGLFVAGMALVMARSRRTELAADDRAAEVTGDPLALAQALARLDGQSWPFVRDDGATARLLASHPDTDERIERLRRRADAAATRIEIR